MLASCNDAAVEGSDIVENNQDPFPTEKVALPPVRMNNTYTDREFSLEEFPDAKLRIGPEVLSDDGKHIFHPLYVNDVRVTVETIDGDLFAYDVNKDGYRDLVFKEKI